VRLLFARWHCEESVAFKDVLLENEVKATVRKALEMMQIEFEQV